MENKILATVNNKDLTMEDLNKALLTATPEARAKIDIKKDMDKLLDGLIVAELISQYGEKINIEEDEAYIQSLEVVKKEIVVRTVTAKVMSEINVTEDELKTIYENNKQHCIKPGIVKLSHILVNSEEKLNSLEKDMKEGIDFKKAVEKYSICPSKSKQGYLGEFTMDKLPKEFKGVVETLESGEISKSFKTDLGYHFLKVDSKTYPSLMNYEEAKPLLKNSFLQQNRMVHYNKFVQKLRDEAVIKKN